MKRGFTLIELLVVVLIIGILAAVALPQYRVAVSKSRLSALMPILRSIQQAQQRYHLANGVYTADVFDLDAALPSSVTVEESSGGHSRVNMDGYIFDIYALPAPGIGDANVTVYDSRRADNSLWLKFSEDVWRCYAWSEAGKRVCRSMGCTVDESGGCTFTP